MDKSKPLLWLERNRDDRIRQKEKESGFITEASATISNHTLKFDGDTKETKLSNRKGAAEIWKKWFFPFIDHVEKNEDVVKAVHYINTDWYSRKMWLDNPTFRDVNARIQLSPEISQKWNEIMRNPKYLNATDNFFKL